VSDRVRDFYDRHPISAAQILAKLGGNPARKLAPADLYPHDQDHYGGLAANDALAEAAAIGPGDLVLDVCSGLGGPARYLAATRRCRVVGVDLHQGRVAGAIDLTRRVGLAERVRFVQGDAMRLAFGAGTFDAAISQEALLHVPDKGRALAEIVRVLKPGGRLAFTDWIAGPELSDADRAMLWTGIAGQSIQTVLGYIELLKRVGFADIRVVNVSAFWQPVLVERLAMYERLRDEARAATGQDVHAEYCRFYAAFVALVGAGRLGGARFAATRPGG
jgi:sarcosine/dimethylglycine N-methyltransferase